MGLDKLLYEVGYVHSKTEAEDITFNEQTWLRLLEYNPTAIYTLISVERDIDQDKIKYFIQLIDKLLEEEESLESYNELNEELETTLENLRRDLVDLSKR